MPDAGSAAPSKGKVQAKSSKAGPSTEVTSERRERFEVKKVKLKLKLSFRRYEEGLTVL